MKGEGEIGKGNWSKVSLPPSCLALAGGALAEAVGVADATGFCPGEVKGWGQGELELPGLLCPWPWRQISERKLAASEISP